MKYRVAFNERACQTVYKILPETWINRSMLNFCLIMLDDEDLVAFKLAINPADIYSIQPTIIKQDIPT